MLELLKGRQFEVRVTLLAATLSLILTGIITIYALGHPRRPALSEPVPSVVEGVEGSEPSSATVQENPQSSPPAAGSNDQSSDLANLWKKQLFFAMLGLGAIVLVNLVSYRWFGQFGYWVYGVVLVMLAVLLLDKFIELPFIPIINGARRWIRIPLGFGSLNIQPSEICKPAYIIALAWYLRYRSNYRNFKALIGPFILTLAPMVLILLEPDLGTVLLMLPIFFAMVFAAGAKVRHLAMIILAALVISPVLWHGMQPYQRLRISSVLLQNDWLRQKAEEHPTLGKILVGSTFSTKRWKNDWAYHLIRSKYAVASGGTTGYGFGRGPFVKYDFLPERHNDFIFAIISHQWGFVGCVVVLLLYVLLFLCGLEIAVANTDPFGRLLATGIVAMFAIQVIVNVMMTVGLMPITGITLPLVSYGGSSLVITMACIGLLNNVGRWRPFTVAPRAFENR
jgi:rod shape determining protein RodA